MARKKKSDAVEAEEEIKKELDEQTEAVSQCAAVSDEAEAESVQTSLEDRHIPGKYKKFN